MKEQCRNRKVRWASAQVKKDTKRQTNIRRGGGNLGWSKTGWKVLDEKKGRLGAGIQKSPSNKTS